VSEPERLRLFVAVDVPHGLREVVSDAAEPLRKRYDSGRWAPIENQHVTLKFLGSTLSDHLEAVHDALGMVARSHAPAKLSVSGLGSFPSSRRMRVLWAGLDDPGELLVRMAADLERAFEPLGYKAEARAFTPHLTLARFRVPVRLEEPLPELPATEPFEIASVELFRSLLHPKGARYEVLESFRLGET